MLRRRKVLHRYHDRVRVSIALAALLLGASGQAQVPTALDWTISIFAGTGEYGHSGDGGPAVEARLRDINAVDVDDAGNLYIAHSGRIRRVDSTGTITTVAGTGKFGYGGDGGPAAEAEFAYVRDVAADSSGNLYIADGHGDRNRIRRVDSMGTITAVDTDGLFAAVVAADGAGNLYFHTHRVIYKRDTAGTITTVAGRLHHYERGEYSGGVIPAVEAQFEGAGDIAVDGSGNLYFSHSNRARIHKVNSTGTITTVAGTGMFGYSGAGGPAVQATLGDVRAVAVDGAGNLYIAESEGACRVRQVDSTGTITTITGGECSYEAYPDPGVFRGVVDIAVDDAGNLYIADVSRIHRLTPLRNDQ